MNKSENTLVTLCLPLDLYQFNLKTPFFMSKAPVALSIILLYSFPYFIRFLCSNGQYMV